jgi:hypothetical protein
MVAEEIEQRWVIDRQGKKLFLLRYYSEHNIYAYVNDGAGYGFIKEDAINEI